MKENPLTSWKAQEYESAINDDVYHKEMHKILKASLMNGKSLIIRKEKKLSI